MEPELESMRPIAKCSFMTNVVTLHTDEQIALWLRGLLTIAWADGNFDANEQELIAALTQETSVTSVSLGSIEPIAPQELAAAFGQDSAAAENFLRTAVMVAIADGIYSICEAHLLDQFCQALGLPKTILEGLQCTLCDPERGMTVNSTTSLTPDCDTLRPVRKWLDGLEIHDPKLARFLCKMIPAQCPFERDVNLFGQKIVHIPPLCKLNPLYEQLVGLRFRALSYLADDCHEDISNYC